MDVLLIYHHAERAQADEIRDLLHSEDYEVGLAPLGFEVGSDAWQQKVMADIATARVVIALLTPNAVHDHWFNWRLYVALSTSKPLLPIQLEPSPIPEPLMMMQFLTLNWIGDRDKRNAILLDSLRTIYQPAPRVACFISYARADSAFVDKLTPDLRGKHISVWRDSDDIPAGASWDREIEKALAACTHLLLVATPTAIASPNVNDEISYALNKGKTIIPLLLQPCDLPLRVHRAQWIDFQGDYHTALAALLRHLGHKD